MRIASAGIATLAIVGAVGWALLDRHAGAAEKAVRARAPAPVVATTTLVAQRDVPIYEAGIGTVAATQSVTVRARIDGQLDRVEFTEGQDVRAGQLLARIDPRALQAQLAQTRAQLAKDTAQLGNARVDLQRYAALVQQDAATQQQVDTQKALVAQLEAAVQFDNAQINFAQVQLGYTEITAPIAGRLGARLVDVGNIVHAADPGGLVVINQIDPISAVFTLPEESFQRINRALQASRTPLTVQAYSRDGSELLGSGRLTLLNNQIDTATGTVQLKAAFDNPQHRLWPGEFVNLHLVLGERNQALTVPAAVVQRSQDGTYAYVVQPDHTVRTQPIKLARVQDGIAIVAEGLSAGERVVVDGQFKLKPGAMVAEATPVASASAAAAK